MKNILMYPQNYNCSFDKQEINHLDSRNINRHCENRKKYSTVSM